MGTQPTQRTVEAAMAAGSRAISVAPAGSGGLLVEPLCNEDLVKLLVGSSALQDCFTTQALARSERNMRSTAKFNSAASPSNTARPARRSWLELNQPQPMIIVSGSSMTMQPSPRP